MIKRYGDGAATEAAMRADVETGTETNPLKAAIWVLERGNQLVAGDGAGVA